MEPGKGGHYISLLKHDFDLLMHHIYPFGLALFCNDVIESLNRFLKLAYTEHSSRGGGALADDGIDPETGLPNKHFYAQSTNLVQCFEWVFLYFDIYLVVHGHPRPRASQATVAFEPSVARAPTLRRPAQLKPSKTLQHARQADRHPTRHHEQQVSPCPSQLHGPMHPPHALPPPPPSRFATQLPS